MTKEAQSISSSLYEMWLKGIMVVEFIKTNIQSKLTNNSTMIPCGRVS